MPQFTIAIPTYNRAHLVSETIACALQQTNRDFELIVCDNASVDETEKVVRSFADPRIVYHRQPSLVPACENFATCADLAKGDWLILNQDDDFISPIFLERCANALRKHPDVVMYAAEALHTSNANHHYGSNCCTLPLKHRWDQPQPRLIPGEQIAAFLWFTSMLSFPALACPIHLFRKHWERDPKRAMEIESMFSARMACEGVVAFDSFIGAVYRQHPDQAGKFITQEMHRSGKIATVAGLTQLFQERNIDWRQHLRAIVSEMPKDFKRSLAYILILDDLIPRDAFEILVSDLATDEGLTPVAYLESVKAKRIDADNKARIASTPARLDKLPLPRPVVRFIRGILYALGKDYNGVILK